MNKVRGTVESDTDTPGPLYASSRWCRAPGKRVFDLLCTIPALVALAPLMLFIGAGVKLTSGSPVLFQQKRLGRNGIGFNCIKFRTMTRTAGIVPGVTQTGDTRVTVIGRKLRKWKLDELPQLINVVRGEMSLVGPRPDLPEFIACLNSPIRHILASLTPGITGWATLHFRNEEELLASVSPEKLGYFYVHQVLPKKTALDLEYASRATFWSDLTTLLRTVAAIFFRSE